jgi:hypothetical protein
VYSARKEIFMLAIANNITTRNRKIAEALRPRPAESVSQRAGDRIKKELAGLRLSSSFVETGGVNGREDG